MTPDQILQLAHEVRRLQKKYKASNCGLDRDDLKRKEAILDRELEQLFKPRNPQQQLFEAR